MASLMSRKLCLVLFLPDPLPYLSTVVGVVVGPLRALEAMRIAQKLGNGPVLTQFTSLALEPCYCCKVIALCSHHSALSPQHPVLIIGVQDFANLCLLPWDCSYLAADEGLEGWALERGRESTTVRDFPGGPMVKTPHFHGRECRFSA